MKKILIIASLICLCLAVYLSFGLVKDISYTKKGFLKTRDKEQEKILNQSVTREFKNASLEDLFKSLSDVPGADFNITYDERAGKAPRPPYNFRFRETNFKEVLWFLSKRCRLKFTWSENDGKIAVRVLDPEMKKTKRELLLGVVLIGLLILIMVLIVVKRGTVRHSAEIYVDSVRNLSEGKLIIRMLEKKNDFMYQVLALEKLGKSETFEARNAVIESLTSTDMLVRKVAFAKLKEKYAVEGLLKDVEKATEKEIKAIRKVVLKDILEDR